MRIEAVSYQNADARRLIEEVQQEYVQRYGGRDESPIDPADFVLPNGLFLVGYLNEQAVACGGWRARGTDAEIKRMYVRQNARRTGLARAILAELERTALAAGQHRMILETGRKQPEAVALYRSAGYCDITPFGYYVDAPLSIHLGKTLS
jgi:GNAT superfamily N-acetyltransferase